MEQSNNSRTKNSILIMVTGVAQKLVNILIGFISRKVFITFLGIEYLGISGLFTDVLSFLSLAELGIGSAITVYLYKPLASHDECEIGKYMQFYKKCYFIIGCVVLGIGLLIVPFLPLMINFDQDVEINLYLIYFLYLANSVSSYWFFAYKSSLIEADQKGYLINNLTTAYSAAASVIKSVVIILFRQFELALFAELAIGIFKNIHISLIADRRYPVLKCRTNDKLEPSTLRKIFYNVRGALVTNISFKLFSATDSTIISVLLGTVYVGLCSNYKMIITYIITIVAILTNSLGAGIGNLIAKEKKEHCIEVFQELDFANFWISSFCSICLFQLLTPFIQLMFGANLTISGACVFLLSIDFFIGVSRNIATSFKYGMGLLKEGCLVALAGGILNVLCSVWWGKLIGLEGVFLASVITKYWSYYLAPGWYVFKCGFGTSPFPYMFTEIKRTVLTIVMMAVVHLCCSGLPSLSWGSFIIQATICAILPNIVFLIIYHRSFAFQVAFMRIKQLALSLGEERM